MRNSEKIFLRLDGNNGATYFWNVSSARDWRQSIDFYRTVSFSAKVKKTVLRHSLFYWERKPLLSGSEVKEAIGALLDWELPFAFDDSFSALISPTRDKAVIHLHGKGYFKFAVGKSFSGVKKELEVYRLLAENTIRSFAFSAPGENVEKTGKIGFFMHYAAGSFSGAVPSARSLIFPLTEFFRIGGGREIPWRAVTEKLTPEIRESVSSDGMTPVGMAHRDFKPWNVMAGNDRPLFFDFESASFDGLPLEDLFNYTVDPALRTVSPAKVWECVRRREKEYGLYLRTLGLPEEAWRRYWHCYLGERCSFWRERGETAFAEKFLELHRVSRA
ncbi:MAG: hypothetical protein MJ016_00600 [Victivallaceae bacterium]|nr:hypothetical protein [Victivallaceae bacterium]